MNTYLGLGFILLFIVRSVVAPGHSISGRKILVRKDDNPVYLRDGACLNMECRDATIIVGQCVLRRVRLHVAPWVGASCSILRVEST